VLTELRQVVLEHLLEQLEDLFHLAIVEAVEGHDWVLGDHVAEGNEGLVLLHIEEEDGRHIGHALNVANVWSMHSEGL
jgi:hypothetical protein